MGEEANFYLEKGIADPRLVAAIKDLKPVPAEPELLAQLIDEFAGFDLATGAFGLDARTREVLQAASPRLTRMRKIAGEIVTLDTDKDYDTVELAISRLLPAGALQADPTLARRAADAIMLIATLPALNGSRRNAHRPPSDETAAAIALAIGTYFNRRGMAYSGEPRSEMVDDTRQHLLKSEQAVLTDAVFRLLGMEMTGAQLGTLMRKANAQLPRKKPRASKRT